MQECRCHSEMEFRPKRSLLFRQIACAYVGAVRQVQIAGYTVGLDCNPAQREQKGMSNVCRDEWYGLQINTYGTIQNIRQVKWYISFLPFVTSFRAYLRCLFGTANGHVSVIIGVNCHSHNLLSALSECSISNQNSRNVNVRIKIAHHGKKITFFIIHRP